MPMVWRRKARERGQAFAQPHSGVCPTKKAARAFFPGRPSSREATRGFCVIHERTKPQASAVYKSQDFGIL